VLATAVRRSTQRRSIPKIKFFQTLAAARPLFLFRVSITFISGFTAMDAKECEIA